MPSPQRRPASLALLAITLLAVVVGLWAWRPWASAPSAGPPGSPSTSDRGADLASGEIAAAGADLATPATARRSEAGWAESDADAAWEIVGRIALDPRTPLGQGGRILAFAGAADDRPGLLRGMMSQLARLDPGAEPRGFSLPTEGEPIADTQVAADGTFSLRVREPHVRLSLDHDYYGLPEPRAVHLDPRQPRVELGRLDTYVGALVRAWTMPPLASGAEAQLIADPDPMGMMRNPEAFLGQVAGGGRRTALAAADGSFVFRQVWPGPFNQVLVRDGGVFAQSERFALTAGELRELRLAPRTGATLEVTVLGPDGASREGAWVRVTPDDVTGDMSRAYASRSGRTDADGHVVLEALRPGPYRLIASATNLLSETMETSIGTGHQSLECQLGAGLSIRGRVVDSDGQPIADAGVRTVPVIEVPILGDVTTAMGTDLAARAAADSDCRTDANGQFELGGLEAGKFHVAGSHPDYLPGLFKNAATGDTEIEVVLERGGTITGRVVADADDRPIREFTIEIVETMFFIDRPSRILRVADAEDGAFTLEQAPLGRVRLKVMATGYGDLEQSVQVEAATTTDAGAMRLLRPATIRGAVRDEFGQPIASARVGRRQRGPMENPIMSSFFGDLSCQTDDEGRFELAGIPPGRIELRATADGFASALSDRLRLEAGQVVDDVLITLGHGGSIVGRLLVPEGMDPAAWDVLPNRMPAGAVASVRPEPDGTFRIDNVDPGRYDVQALRVSTFQQLDQRTKRDWAPGRQLDLGSMFSELNELIVHASCTVRAGEEVEVELDASHVASDAAVLDLRIELGDRPLENGYVEVRHQESGRTWFGFLQQGQLRQRGVAPGALRIQVRGGLTMAPVGMAQRVDFDPATGPVTIRLPGGTIEGQVLDASDGRPLRAALVRVYQQDRIEPDDAVEFGFALSDEEGRFRFEGLPDGTYTVIGDNRMTLASPDDVAGRVRDIRIQGGSTRDVTVRGSPGSGIAVHVTTALGAPASGATVLALGADGKPLGTLPVAHTNVAGTAHLSGLTQGTVRILARGAGSSPVASESMELGGAQRREARLQLRAGAHVRVTVVDARGEVVRGAALGARRGDGPWVPGSMLVISREGDRIDPRDARKWKLGVPGRAAYGRPVSDPAHHSIGRPSHAAARPGVSDPRETSLAQALPPRA